mmetsp:Transcript_24289/g.70041  ORF Transcript_24289/g.70041 Transcript_24289/m.70041 type:complete len:87 (-) Transcript_24289:1000-1260(-)
MRSVKRAKERVSVCERESGRLGDNDNPLVFSININEYQSVWRVRWMNHVGVSRNGCPASHTNHGKAHGHTAWRPIYRNTHPVHIHN